MDRLMYCLAVPQALFEELKSLRSMMMLSNMGRIRFIKQFFSFQLFGLLFQSVQVFSVVLVFLLG